MSNNIKIEPVQEADLPSVRSLLTELMGTMTNTEGFDVNAAVENCRFLVRDPAQHMLVARQGDNVVGFINFSTRRTIMHPGSSGLIDELVVSNVHRGTGIGKKLIESVVERCRLLGCCEVDVSTEKTNTRARRFYRTCGFEEDAVLLELDFANSEEREG